MSSFLDLYDPLDIIGNGSFGIIRKVRRRVDGMIFARKELNFERMNERDRKQIVAEVNILKDLQHEHIVRYIDRYVDRDAGILYILMEYCGGGDLSTVIKQAAKHNRPIPEDTVWNYFMQILLALQHCHHPNGHVRSSSSSSGGVTAIEGGSEGCRDRRVQILHRDLKPDNVFLDDNNTVKLGDFGLSKALAQASFANTYVGTPYYMSPELMQEKAYDSKSDIWSLGCLIYELCALKPPFHEAKTHAELSICIRNGRIPPLPRGYSQALSNVIKSMLSLNPAMRPSAAQLLQHERLELVFKVSETEKMLATVKAHKIALASKERELMTREGVFLEKERNLATLLARKDTEIATLQKHLAQIQQIQRCTRHDVEVAIRNAVTKREEELRIAVMQREEEVKAAMTKREEEIAEAVRKREVEVCEAWARREVEIAREVETRITEMGQRVDAIKRREEELKTEELRLRSIREELEDGVVKWEDSVKARKEKTPLEEVKNLLTPLARVPQKTEKERRFSSDATPTLKAPAIRDPSPPIETPESRAMFSDFMPSAMKGVILTSTGEVLETPTPTELANIFKRSPKVGLNFATIFDFSAKANKLDISASDGEDDSPPPSPSSRKEKERLGRRKSDMSSSEAGSSSSGSNLNSSATTSNQASEPPTRLRKPSIKTSATSGRTSLTRTATVPMFSGAKKTVTTSSTVKPKAQSQSAAEFKQNQNTVTFPAPVQRSKSAPLYDLEDEENLPSPFLKRVEREQVVVVDDEDNLPSPFLKRAEREQVTHAAANVTKGSAAAGGTVKGPSSGPSTGVAPVTGTGGTGTVTKKRATNGNMLRAMAAANNVAGRRGTTPTPSFANGPSSPTRASAARAAQIQVDSHYPGRPLQMRRVSEGKILSRS
ncbi:hypothetical protein AX15_005296 [Amanita polypyramis BW_CC]|nr:hypothetical protein AX15_005296 [Amanita polypyramis BW_CC]